MSKNKQNAAARLADSDLREAMVGLIRFAEGVRYRMFLSTSELELIERAKGARDG